MFEKIFGQNSLEMNEKKITFLDSASVFENEQNGICEILENYSSFCTKERIDIKF